MLLRRNQWSENGHGRVLQSNGRAYQVTRELVGESERISIQAAVMIAERWTTLMPEDITRFLADEDGKDSHASAKL